MTNNGFIYVEPCELEYSHSLRTVTSVWISV